MLSRIATLFTKILRHHAKDNYLSEKDVYRLEDKLNYKFHDKTLIVQALKHRSFLSVTNELRLSSNERLELLGDAVLGMVVTEFLFKRFPTKEEGELTAIKSLMVSRKILARIAKQIGIGEFILLNDAEEKAGGRNRASIVADAFEAIIGAIYLDGGLDTVIDFIHTILLVRTDKIISEEQNKNFKSMLLEYSQSKNLGLPQYVVRNEEGPDHDKLFTIEVLINNKVLGMGKGNSKKRAEQISAKNALKKLNIL
ncbi:MAG: ribonuclease III [bacterium]|nr:MAG: ribonuclease III [bacterium]